MPIYEVFSKFEKFKDVAKKFEAAINPKPIRFKLIEQTTGKPLAITDDSMLCMHDYHFSISGVGANCSQQVSR